MHSPLRYVVCDVFSDRPLAGNQLAVFTNASQLSASLMQSLAREMNFAESVFVLRAEAGGHARLRIFTPTREIPFAGHPTLGAAVVLGQPMQVQTIRLETGAGIIPVQLTREGAKVVAGRMSQPVPRFETVPDPAPLLKALGLAGSELPIERYDLGPQHIFVAASGPEQVAQLQPDLASLSRFDAGINVFAADGDVYKTRMFAPAHGVAEDAATGSAAGPLAVHLARHGRIGFGEDLAIDQGAEIGRPSRLYAVAHGHPGGIERVEVWGDAVVVAHGEFRLPRGLIVA